MIVISHFILVAPLNDFRSAEFIPLQRTMIQMVLNLLMPFPRREEDKWDAEDSIPPSEEGRCPQRP